MRVENVEIINIAYGLIDIVCDFRWIKYCLTLVPTYCTAVAVHHHKPIYIYIYYIHSICRKILLYINQTQLYLFNCVVTADPNRLWSVLWYYRIIGCSCNICNHTVIIMINYNIIFYYRVNDPSLRTVWYYYSLYWQEFNNKISFFFLSIVIVRV